MDNKSCHECGESLKGRSDKKFCCDECRNSFNNRINGNATNYIRNVNNILRRNRRILEGIIDGDETKTSYDSLLETGFDFRFYTHMITTRKGLKYLFCYEFGYLFIDSDAVLIVRKVDSKEFSHPLDLNTFSTISAETKKIRKQLELIR